VQATVDAALLEGGLGLKRGKAYLPLRAAVCGASISPPLPESMALLGRDRVLRRLRAAAEATSGGATPGPDVR
jgi:glutamyl-tRNA synthetase